MSTSKPSARPRSGRGPNGSEALRAVGEAGDGDAALEAVKARAPRPDRLGTKPRVQDVDDVEIEIPDNAYRVDLPDAGFEGPLDLLLHLIQKHELNILDIPVSFVTERYLAYLGMMRVLTIDVASEYLVMAATLAHIKSKMLLPTMPSGQEDTLLEDEEDPREELVRRLLEYQKYKAAAVDLASRGTLGKDVFARGTKEPVAIGAAPFAEVGVFSLLDAFDKIIKHSKVEVNHEVVFDRISITDRMIELTDRLGARKGTRFEDLFDGVHPTRFDVIITFLAILEMAKLRMLRVYQSASLETIYLELASQEPGSTLPVDEPGPVAEEPPSAEAVEGEEEVASARDDVASARDDAEVVMDDEEVVMGDEEVVMGDEEVVMGDEEVVVGDEEVVAGDEEVVAGDEEVVVGDEEVPPGAPSPVLSDELRAHEGRE